MREQIPEIHMSLIILMKTMINNNDNKFDIYYYSVKDFIYFI